MWKTLSRRLKRLSFRSSRREVQFVLHSEFKDLVIPQIDARLAPLGFELQNGLLWVNNHTPPIRPTFEILFWKGAAAAPRWGLSLDFVPHQTGERFAWHRTAKSARADLFIDARSRDLDLSMLYGKDHLRKQIPDALDQSLTQAMLFWGQISEVKDLPKALELAKARLGPAASADIRYFGLAGAFIHAATGEVDHGEAVLEEWIVAHELTSVQISDLRRRFVACMPADLLS